MSDHLTEYLRGKHKVEAYSIAYILSVPTEVVKKRLHEASVPEIVPGLYEAKDVLAWWSEFQSGGTT